jgi:3-oxoacyl-[acyl-carrier-protein] synthase II
MKRVVVTGMGGLTALGERWADIEPRLRARKNAVRRMPEWDYFVDLHTRLGAPIDGFEAPEHYPRRTVRSMGRVALLAVRATELALMDAGLRDDPTIRDGRMGIAYGSSFGSAEPVQAFGQMMATGKLQGVSSTTYIQMMSHTAAVNIGLYFGLRGRVIPTSSACTSGSQAIGYAYESIKFGRQMMMVAGGSEELNLASAAVFDTLFAASTRNDTPDLTPRPFDRNRDGLVVGEGAATLVLEDLDHARARGARIYAEIVGYACNSDGAHVTQPEAETMAVVMRLALEDAGISPAGVGYVNAHGTATDRGDIAETKATYEIFGSRIPISSLKSYLGHTLGACGAIEAWFTIEMMRRGWYAPTVNLDNPDPACAELQYIVGAGASMDNEYVMTNNFAFGGINTSLVLRRLSL